MKSTKTLLPFLFFSFFLISCENEELEEQNNQEFIEYTIDGEESVIILEGLIGNFYPSGPDSSYPKLQIGSLAYESNSCFYLLGFLNDSNYLGTYYNLEFQPNDVGMWVDDFDSISLCPNVFNISQNNNNITYDLTTLGEVGEFIDINFSGDYIDYDGNPHSINGVIHVIRDE